MKITEEEYLENRRESAGIHIGQDNLVNIIKFVVLVAALIGIRLLFMY